MQHKNLRDFYTEEELSEKIEFLKYQKTVLDEWWAANPEWQMNSSTHQSIIDDMETELEAKRREQHQGN